jgi:hypothetical protein
VVVAVDWKVLAQVAQGEMAVVELVAQMLLLVMLVLQILVVAVVAVVQMQEEVETVALVALVLLLCDFSLQTGQLLRKTAGRRRLTGPTQSSHTTHRAHSPSSQTLRAQTSFNL